MKSNRTLHKSSSIYLTVRLRQAKECLERLRTKLVFKQKFELACVKESHISNASEWPSKGFNFRIKGFSCGICSSVVKVV